MIAWAALALASIDFFLLVLVLRWIKDFSDSIPALPDDEKEAIA